jgi:predicted nuclease of restriction endonuclease-like (RecB) superfamily
MKPALFRDKKYRLWLAELKGKVRSAQLKAAVAVNTQLLEFYWELGADIVAKQASTNWGDGLIPQLSKDLSNEFPGMSGFSRTNLMYIQKWHVFYSRHHTIVQQPVGQLAKQPVSQLGIKGKGQQLVGQIGQQPVAQLTSIPWGHNIAIISKCKTVEEALFYVQRTIEHGWSRSVLVHQIESGLYRRGGKAVNNFAATMPKPQSDLAEQTLKDPYVFDFLDLAVDHKERELETALVDHVSRFLLELGAGFAYLGRQVPLNVGSREFFLDLLFYHTKLHCHVVVELKTSDFEPEHAGKLNFYLKAVDAQLRGPEDKPTVGLLICKSKDKLVVEYALSDIRKPIGVSEYRLTRALPKKIQSSLPAIKEIEEELRR